MLGEKWITKYLKLAKTLADDNAACHSRKIGVILVSEHNRIISAGYNGAASGVPHPDSEEYLEHLFVDLLDDVDRSYISGLYKIKTVKDFLAKFGNQKLCPRRILGCKSGDRLELCPCAHAERNALSGASQQGVSTNNSIMYCYCGVPCHECTIQIIQSGVKAVVCLKSEKGEADYSKSSRWLFKKAGVKLIEVSPPL